MTMTKAQKIKKLKRQKLLRQMISSLLKTRRRYKHLRASSLVRPRGCSGRFTKVWARLNAAY